jgi:ribosomal protein L37AE/L43A
MKVKEKQIPRIVLKLQALLPRTSPIHIKAAYVKDDLAKFLAGYKGEKSIDFHLSFLPKDDYFIFHDLRLFDGERYFQIDILVLSRRSIFILEVKNMSGSLEFDRDFNQLIQMKNGQEKAFPDPVLQLQRQKSQFKKWLVLNHLPHLPIHGLVVISNPQTVIKSTNKHTNKVVLHSNLLPHRIIEINNKNNTEQISQKEIKKIIRKTIKMDTPLNSSILDHYQMTRNDIKKGIFCPFCNHIPLDRGHGYWVCSKCSTKSKDAHLKALIEYELLFGDSISSSELKDFLMISSSSLASRILNSVASITEGTTKGRVYTLYKK